MTSNPSERLAPHSVEAEEAVLGAILLDPDVMLELSPFLNQESFYILRHSWIWEAMERIVERNETIDNLSVMDELRNQGHLDEVGGGAYISHLINSTPTSLHAEAYGRIVERAAIRRGFLNGASEVANFSTQTDINIDDVIDYSISAIMDKVPQSYENDVFSIGEALVNFDLDMRTQRLELSDGLLGANTGLIDLNMLLTGLRPDFLYTLTGRTGLGKTALALQIAKHVAKCPPHPTIGSNLVVIFSTEMNEKRVIQRMLSNETRINSLSLQYGDFQNKDKEYQNAFHMLSQLPIVIVDARGYNVTRIKRKCESIRRKYGKIGLIMVDLLNDVGLVGLHQVATGKSNTSRKDELGYIIRELKTMSSNKGRMFEFGCPVLTVAQSNRETMKGGKPSLFGLADAADIEHSSDCVIGIYQLEEESDKLLHAGVLKHRDGPTGTCTFYYEKECYRFGDYKAGD